MHRSFDVTEIQYVFGKTRLNHDRIYIGNPQPPHVFSLSVSGPVVTIDPHVLLQKRRESEEQVKDEFG